MKIQKIFVTTLLVFGLTVSCNDDILDKTNPNTFTTDSYFRTGDQAVAAINAVYASFQGTNLYNRQYFFLQDLLSYDVQTGGAQLDATYARVLNSQVDPANAVVSSVWTGLYAVITRANLAIEFVPNTNEAITPQLKNRIIAEAHFLRAFAYFELVSLWGRVPIYTKAATSANEVVGRSASEDEVYNLILSDLKKAEEGLPLVSEYRGKADLGRASKGAAQSLAGKVQLFRGKYAEAKAELLKVVNSNQYRLVDNFSDNFIEETENNMESIFEIQYTEQAGASGWTDDGGGNHPKVTFRGQEYGPNAWRNLIPSDGLVGAFEKVAKGAAKDDPRYTFTLYSIGDPFNNGTRILTAADVQGDVTKPSWKKYQTIYKRPGENSQSGINFRVIRYADVLLMLAEAENELTGPAAALPYINQVRARPSVNMPPYPTAQFPTASKDQMLMAIMHERRVELSGEQIRNRDIRRWRKFNKFGAAEPITGFIKNKHELLPLPLSEIDNNEALTNNDQNPGY